MAKEDNGSVRITVIHFETTSSNETLRQNIKEIANTISRSLMPPPRQQPLQPLQIPSGNGSDQIDELDGADYLDVETVSEAPKLRNKTNRIERTPNILEDIDFTSGDVPFREFYEQTGKPSANIKRYLLITSWFKEHRGLPEITVDHIYTCYRFMGAGWNIPKHPSQPFRDMKSKGWVVKGSGGAYKLHHIGETFINEMKSE